MNKREKERDAHEAQEFLRAIIAPGDTIYTILRHVSRSGMSRSISCMIIDKDGEPVDVSGFVARAIGERFDRDNGGVKVGGCGMDMGFHLVYTLSYTLFPDGFGCVGARCPCNDHSNGDRDYTPHGAVTGCREDVCTCHDDTAWSSPKSYLLGCSSCGCHRAEHWHTDGGYALTHRWL